MNLAAVGGKDSCGSHSQVNRGHLVQNEIRQRGRLPVIRSARLNTHRGAFVGFLREINNELEVIRQFQFTRLRLNSPR